MAIKSLYIENFKGIKDPTKINIKPITLFIGKNSSGKSSCIHALTALSQTTKIQYNTKPLILDDEYASIHLGRFIEVVHTKSYNDHIGLGIEIDNVRLILPDSNRRSPKKVSGEACFDFRCTKRTQDIYLSKATYKIDDFEYEANRKGSTYNYDMNYIAKNISVNYTLEKGFMFDQHSIFLGFKEEYINFMPLHQLQLQIQESLQSVYYLGPFRQSPLRRYPTRGASPSEVGAQGEHTATLLANEAVQSRTRSHINQISQWLGTMGLAKKIDVGRIGSSDLFDLNISLPDDKKFPIADLGYGVSQILPVLTQCSFANNGSTLLFEQPELHLHPESAKMLSDVFIETIKRKNCTILVETHSLELLTRLQGLIRDEQIPSSSVAAYLVTRDNHKTNIRQIDIDENGENYDVNWRKNLTGE